jgi:hypothetical protein
MGRITAKSRDEHKPDVNVRAVPVPGTPWCSVVAVRWIRRITVVVL